MLEAVFRHRRVLTTHRDHSAYTKFKLSGFFRSEDEKDVLKFKNVGDLGWSGSLIVIFTITVRYSAYDVLFTFHRNYLSILSRFPDIVRYLLKPQTFPSPRVFDADVRRGVPVMPVKFHQDLCNRKP